MMSRRLPLLPAWNLQVSAVSGAPREAAAPAVELDSSKRPLILAIESSCDETAASIIDGQGGLHSDVVASQIDFHSRFGGVVPEIASRKHIEAICGVCDECLATAAASLGVGSVRWRDLDAVAVTYAPGLVGALVVGLAFAKGAAWGADKPLIAVNHLEGHLYANRIAEPGMQPPMVVSLVSGGHTMLVHVRDWGDYETMGSTIDDAVGEAFDKVAKALGLGYPGGPIISQARREGQPQGHRVPARAHALGRFALQPFGFENRRDYVYSKGAAGWSRAEHARYRREFRGGGGRCAGGEGEGRAHRDGREGILPWRRRGGEPHAARRLREDVQKARRSSDHAAAFGMRRPGGHDC